MEAILQAYNEFAKNPKNKEFEIIFKQVSANKYNSLLGYTRVAQLPFVIDASLSVIHTTSKTQQTRIVVDEAAVQHAVLTYEGKNNHHVYNQLLTQVEN